MGNTTEFSSNFLVEFFSSLFHVRCFKEKVSIAVLDPVTFIMKAEALFEFEESIADVAMEGFEGGVLLALSATYSGVRIYYFDGRVFELTQVKVFVHILCITDLL